MTPIPGHRELAIPSQQEPDQNRPLDILEQRFRDYRKQNEEFCQLSNDFYRLQCRNLTLPLPNLCPDLATVMHRIEGVAQSIRQAMATMTERAPSDDAALFFPDDLIAKSIQKASCAFAKMRTELIEWENLLLLYEKLLAASPHRINLYQRQERDSFVRILPKLSLPSSAVLESTNQLATQITQLYQLTKLDLSRLDLKEELADHCQKEFHKRYSIDLQRWPALKTALPLYFTSLSERPVPPLVIEKLSAVFQSQDTVEEPISHLHLLFSRNPTLQERWEEGESIALTALYQQNKEQELSKEKRMEFAQNKLVAYLSLQRTNLTSYPLMLAALDSSPLYKRDARTDGRLNNPDALIARLLQRGIPHRHAKNLLKKLFACKELDVGIKKIFLDYQKELFPIYGQVAPTNYQLCDSKDPSLLFRSGAEIDRSCLDYNNHYSRVNLGLIGLLCRQDLRLLILLDKGEMVARAIFRLLLDETTGAAVLQLERSYTRAIHPDYRQMLQLFAIHRARKLQLPLVRICDPTEDAMYCNYPHPLRAIGDNMIPTYIDDQGLLTQCNYVWKKNSNIVLYIP